MKYFLYIFSLIIGLFSIYQWKIGLLLFALLIFMMIFLYRKKKLPKKELLIDCSFFIFGVALSSLSLYHSKASSINQIGIVISSKKNYYIFLSGFTKYYVYHKNNPYQFLDIIQIQGKISSFHFTTYECQMDFEKYLNQHGVYFSLNTYQEEMKFGLFIRLKNIYNWIEKKYDEKSASIILKMIFNYSFSSEWDSLLEKNNLLYLFTFSSFHYYLIISGIKKVIKDKIKEKNFFLIEIIILLPLLFITNMKIGLLKITIYVIINYFYQDKGKEDKIMITYILLLLIHPTYVIDSTFLLSFGLSLFLVFIQASKSMVKGKWKSLYLSIMIYLFIVPFSIQQNYVIYPLNFFYSVFFTPLVTVFFFLIIFFPIPNLINYCGNILYCCVSLLDKGNVSFTIGNINIVFCILYYLVLLNICLFIEIKRKTFIHYAIMLEIITLAIFSLPIQHMCSEEVTFINVGQGDSTLIRTHHKVALIDTGGVVSFDMAKKTLIPFLHKNKINRIDVLFITHQDYDHCGAKESLMDNFNVKEVLSYNQFYEYRLGNVIFKNLNQLTGDEKEENEKSLVLSLSIHKKLFLFMGDAPKSVEEKIIKKYPFIQCDYLKVGHHGSNTSSSDIFIKTLLPKEAIISVGKNNIYGHPNEETLITLNKYNVRIRRTDIEGSITYKWYN